MSIDNQLSDVVAKVVARCNECRACVRLCPFLSEFGTPLAIAAGIDVKRPETFGIAYACTLCGLCDEICPHGVSTVDLFYTLRRYAVDFGSFSYKTYRSLLGYERWGRGKLLSLFAIPLKARSVFFPGCSLPGTRPAQVLLLYELLCKLDPETGIVLSCCMKPSHDLGRSGPFREGFAPLKKRLLESAISRVYTACPSCYQIFSEYLSPIETLTVWEALSCRDFDFVRKKEGDTCFLVHDPCVVRKNSTIQDAVRTIAEKCGAVISEPVLSRNKTLCCGEGGGVIVAYPETGMKWRAARLEHAGEKPILTYCAGCASNLGAVTPAVHLADIIYESFSGRKPLEPGGFLAGYVNRLILKKRLAKRFSRRVLA